MFRWIVSATLAGAHRPRAGNKMQRQVPKRNVDAWIRVTKRRFRIRSIICLLHHRELRRYENLPGGLVSYYRANGFMVKHIPARNYQKPSLSKRKLRKVWKAYKKLPKPVLIHCSAGISRTGAATRYIKQRERHLGREKT